MLSDSGVHVWTNGDRRTTGATRLTRKRIWQRVTLAAIAAGSGATSLRAADVNWDNGSGNFSWDTSSLNWSGAAWNNANGDGAIFGATGVGAISVPGPINVNSINFTVDGYSLNGTGPINFVPGTSTQTSGVVNVAASSSATINPTINSTVGFQKIGAGTLTLNGSAGSIVGNVGLDGRSTLQSDVLVGGSFGNLNGGFLKLGSANALPSSARVSIGTGYLDIGSNNVTIGELIYTNQLDFAPWNTTLNANNGVIGSGTLRVLGDINVIGVSGGNSSNAIAANLDLGGGTQVVRIAQQGGVALSGALIFTGSLSNGSLLKSYGTSFNGVQAQADGLSLFGNNTYTGSTVLNAGNNVIAGTNATSAIKIAGSSTGGSVINFIGANGSAQGATLLQAFSGSGIVLDNNHNPAFIAGPPTAAAQNNDRIRDDAAVQLRDGNFTYRGLTTVAASETYGSMSVLGGHNILTITPNGVGGTAALTAAGNLTMAPRSTMQIAGTTLGAAGKVFFNGSIPTADSTGILPRVVGSSDFLTYNGTTGMTPYTGYSADFNTAGTNVAITAATNVASSVNINALKRTGSFTLTIDPGQTLGITSGMILNTSGTGSITGGTLAFGPNPGVLFGTQNISSAITGSDGIIVASGTGTFSGDMSGLSGTLDVYGSTANINTNTFTGPIRVRTGFLNLNVSQTGSGLGAITLGVPENDSNLVPTNPSLSISGAGANATFARDIIVNNGATSAAGAPLRYTLVPGISALNNSTGTQTFTGNVTLNTGLRLQGGGAAATSTGATVFTGDITGPGRFYIANGRAIFSGNYSNAGGFLIGDGGFTAKVSFLGTGSGSGSMLISSNFGGATNQTTMSYVNGGLQSGPIMVWNSGPGQEPHIIPLNNSTINNEVRLGIGPKPGEEGNAIVNVGSGITAEWAGPLSGFSPLTKIGTGVLTLSNATSTYTGTLIVNDGQLLAAHARAMGTPTLTVNGGTAKLSPGLGTAVALRGVSVNLSAGKFDITNNAVVVDYTPPDTSPFDSIRAAIVSAYNGGGATAWTGNGITTSNGNASEFAIGYAEASDLTTIPSVFGSVDGTAVLFRHTRYGDADLNGLVSLDDFNRLAGNFGGVNKVWSQGDFDYDGNVNLNDFNLLAGNFGLSAGPDGVVGPGDWAALGSAVPEPSAVIPLLVTGLACLRRRRRSACAKC